MHDALGEGAALAQALPGFVPRKAQQHLAVAVADAFEQREVLLAEAGTGTGKTFAYLVPALLSGLKTIISTGTRALQDQLYHRDLLGWGDGRDPATQVQPAPAPPAEPVPQP